MHVGSRHWGSNVGGTKSLAGEEEKEKEERRKFSAEEENEKGAREEGKKGH